jgi:aminopeptidase-like protein
MGKVAPKKNDGAVNKVKISTEKKAALSEQKKVERLKRKSEKRRMLSNPLNLPLRSLYGDFKDNEQDNDDKKPIQSKLEHYGFQHLTQLMYFLFHII